jgi:hypothetical protein
MAMTLPIKPSTMSFFERFFMRHNSSPLTKIVNYGFITALAALVPLNAQSFDRFKYGVLISYPQSTGDLKKFTSDKVSGEVGYGLFTELALSQQFAFRPRIERVAFKGENYASESLDTMANCLSFAGDLMLRHGSGTYFFAGANYLMPSINNRFRGGGSNLDNGLGVSAGIGWYSPKPGDGFGWAAILSSFGWELRYTKSLGLKLADEDFSFDWLQVSAFFRF